MAKDKSLTQWYARNVDRYSRKTSHLSLVEHGVYGVLLDHYYKTEAPLPTKEEQIQRICRAIATHEIEALQSVLRQFFILKEDGYHNITADEEIENRRKLSEKRSSSAKSKQTTIQTPIQNSEQNLKQKDSKTGPIADTATATLTATLKLASYEKCEEEVLPATWHDVAEKRGVPDEQIYKSWRKFKEITSFPYEFEKWKAWIAKERFKGQHLEAAE